MSLALMILVVVAGAGLAVQAAVNSRLRVGIGNPILSALVSFAVGAVALGLVLLSGVFGRTRLAGSEAAPWWAWTGGLAGAFYVALAVIAVPRIGTALLIAGAVLGQMVGALVLDSFGWLGVPKVPLNVWRVLGAALVLVGVALMQRKG